MIRLKIIKIDKSIYNLIDEHENTYTLNLDFLDSTEELKVRRFY